MTESIQEQSICEIIDCNRDCANCYWLNYNLEAS